MAHTKQNGGRMFFFKNTFKKLHLLFKPAEIRRVGAAQKPPCRS